MTDNPPRPFLMSDAMILVAATAFGLAGSRNPSISSSGQSLVAATSILSAWSMACLLLRLRRPRPPIARLINQPGVSAWLAGGVPAACLHLLALRSSTDPLPYHVGSIYLSGLSVSAVWAIQKIGEELRPEASWVDRLGVGLGWGWIALFLVLTLPHFLGF